MQVANDYEKKFSKAIWARWKPSTPMPSNCRCATPPGKPGGFDSREVTYGWG